MDRVNPVETLPVLRRHREETYTTTDQIAVEVPVALVYNGISHAVMMATPQHLENFALGFSLTEGIIETPDELYALDVVPGETGIQVKIQISERRFQALKQKRRTLAGQTGCGICGAESLQQFQQLPAPVSNGINTTAAVISKAMSLLPHKQLLNQSTGALHAAAWANRNGDIVEVREDVGRHNALDKLIGELSKTRRSEGFLLMTSRTSYELVIKAAKSGINILAAISAPTSLAMTIAEQLNITLLGFTRDERFVVYTHPAAISDLQTEVQHG